MSNPEEEGARGGAGGGGTWSAGSMREMSITSPASSAICVPLPGHGRTHTAFMPCAPDTQLPASSIASSMAATWDR
jgi:hypothetical protein